MPHSDDPDMGPVEHWLEATRFTQTDLEILQTLAFTIIAFATLWAILKAR